MIPISIQNYTTARLSEIDSSISALVKERDELRRWLDESTRPDAVACAPVVAPTMDPAVPRRANLVFIPKSGGTQREQRYRMAGNTSEAEFYYDNNGYRKAARDLSIGVHDRRGVWLTLPELEKLQASRRKVR